MEERSSREAGVEEYLPLVVVVVLAPPKVLLLLLVVVVLGALGIGDRVGRRG